MILALQILGYLAVIPMLWQIGNGIVRRLLHRSGVPKAPASKAHAAPPANIRAGRYIAFLERFLIVAGLLMNSWDIIVAVIALKTVARYKELDEQISAEYFLIGSLASILWAVFVATAISAYDGTLGLHLLSHAGPASPEQNPVLQYIGAQMRRI